MLKRVAAPRQCITRRHVFHVHYIIIVLSTFNHWQAHATGIPLRSMTDLSLFYGIKFRLAMLILSLGLLAGCQTPSTVSVEESETLVSETGEQSGFGDYQYSPEDQLLTDILAAGIAIQRGKKEEALEYLSRAAEQSEDKRLIMQTFQLAIEMESYQQAISLAHLFRDIEPDNPRAGIMLADVHFKLGQMDEALENIRESILSLSENDFFVLRAVVIFLSGQSSQTILDDYLTHAKQYPDDARVTMVAAQLAYQVEDREQFSRLIDETLSLDPDWEEAAVMKLNAMTETGSDSVLDYARQHLAEFAEHKMFRIEYANHLIHLGFEELALAQANLILQQDPNYLDALIMAGSLQFDRDHAKSRDFLKRYLELGGVDSQAIFYLSEIAKQEKSYKEALNRLYAIGNDNGFYLEARIRIGRIYEERDGVEAGIRYLDGIAIHDQSELMQIMFEKDRMYQDAGEYEKSRALFDDMLARDPDNTRVLYRRGLLFANMDLLDLHEMDMRKLIELEPDNAYAYNALGYVLADKTDRLQEAYELINIAMELRPDDPYITDSLGWIYYRLGDNELAIQYLTEASEILWDAEIAAHLGEVLWITDERQKANELWDRALEDFPDHPVLNETIQRLREINSQAISNLMLQYVVETGNSQPFNV